MKTNSLINSFISLFYPSLCVGCKKSLCGEEEFLCLHCQLQLPRTGYISFSDNLPAERFYGKAKIERAYSYLYYNKDGLGQKIVAEIKYKGNRRLGKWMGEYLAKDLQTSGFFDGIDYLIPVPLHPRKQKKRGFNQSRMLAEGIASLVQIPVNEEILYRSVAHSTQTQKGVFDRWKNTQSNFSLRNSFSFEGKHVLLIDDVLTTGSTLDACITSLLETPEIKISILSLAIA